jgi:hypothetical protein
MTTTDHREIIIDCAKLAEGGTVDIRLLERRVFSRAVVVNSAQLSDQASLLGYIDDLRNRGYTVTVES